MNPVKLLMATGLISICASCATLVSKTKYPVTVDSSPRQASVSILDRRGMEVFNGSTPALAYLKSGAGFFKSAKYTVIITKDGYNEKKVTLTSGINGWYFGNIVFGGVIGLLIVDPASGAMYRLKLQDVNETLVANSTTTSNSDKRSLRILDIADVPAEWKDKLVLIAKQ